VREKKGHARIEAINKLIISTTSTLNSFGAHMMRAASGSMMADFGKVDEKNPLVQSGHQSYDSTQQKPTKYDNSMVRKRKSVY
jgi:hypothetical protein